MSKVKKYVASFLTVLSLNAVALSPEVPKSSHTHVNGVGLRMIQLLGQPEFEQCYQEFSQLPGDVHEALEIKEPTVNGNLRLINKIIKREIVEKRKIYHELHVISNTFSSGEKTSSCKVIVDRSKFICPILPMPMPMPGCTLIPQKDYTGCVSGYVSKCEPVACPVVPEPMPLPGCTLTPKKDANGCVLSYASLCEPLPQPR